MARMTPLQWWVALALVAGVILTNAAIQREQRSRRHLWPSQMHWLVPLPAGPVYMDPPPRVDPLSERALQAPLTGAT